MRSYPFVNAPFLRSRLEWRVGPAAPHPRRAAHGARRHAGGHRGLDQVSEARPCQRRKEAQGGLSWRIKALENAFPLLPWVTHLTSAGVSCLDGEEVAKTPFQGVKHTHTLTHKCIAFSQPSSQYIRISPPPPAPEIRSAVLDQDDFLLEDCPPGQPAGSHSMLACIQHTSKPCSGCRRVSFGALWPRSHPHLPCPEGRDPGVLPQHQCHQIVLIVGDTPGLESPAGPDSKHLLNRGKECSSPPSGDGNEAKASQDLAFLSSSLCRKAYPH